MGVAGLLSFMDELILVVLKLDVREDLAYTQCAYRIPAGEPVEQIENLGVQN